MKMKKVSKVSVFYILLRWTSRFLLWMSRFSLPVGVVTVETAGSVGCSVPGSVTSSVVAISVVGDSKMMDAKFSLFDAENDCQFHFLYSQKCV